MKKVLLIACIVIIAASCSRGGGKESSVSGDYVVKVGDVKLTKDDVRVAWNALPVMGKQVFEGPDGTARFIAEMARRESLYLEAKKRGLDKDKEVQMRLEEARKNTLAGYLLRKVGEDDSPPTEKAMREYYDTHKDDFISRDRIRVSRIVVKSRNDAKNILEKLKSGLDFAKLASEVSVDKTTAGSGGDMGFIDRNSKVAPQLAQEVIRTRKGEVGGPVALQDGFYIIKVTDIKGTLPTYEEVRGALSLRMTAERRKAAIDKLLESIKKSYKIDINKTALAQLPPLSQPDRGNMPLPPGHPLSPAH